MIDTVILSLPTTEAEILRRSIDGTPAWSLQGRKVAYDTYIKEPLAEDLESGLYFPKATAFRRKGTNGFWSASLRIEFSAPKLVYGNNIEELSEAQFDDVVVALDDRLRRLGLTINVEQLKTASVRAVHYSKNIEMQDGYSAMYAIAEISKINLNTRFDLSRTRYMNDGQSLCMYTRSHSFVIYDKMADLLRGKGKAIDMSQTQKQDTLAATMKGRDVLRLEVRLSEKRKMNAVFRKAGFAENPTFRDVFATDKSKAVLNHYWQTTVAGNGHILFAHAPTPKEVLKYLLLAIPGMGARQAIFLTGLLLLIRDGNGIRELRTILTQYVANRTWYRIADEIKATEASMATLQPRGWYGQIVSALSIYQPFQMGNECPDGVKLTV